ncbi:MAG TPA: HEPN domain-containing protein [archaeon]|nr:HEPN domain-containing protein [archaeon]
MKIEAEKWLKIAKDDLEKAEILFRNSKFDGAAFYCEQSAEKALKAVQIEAKGKLRKIHDLVELGKDVSAPETIINKLKELTQAYIYSRYPDAPESSQLKEIVTGFFKDVKEVLLWSEKKLLKTN